jgi:beta-lactam-binding protein with PASTA domain
VRFLKTIGFHFLLMVLFLYFAAWLAAFFLSGYTRHGQYLTLPDLKGLTLESAETLLKQKNLRYVITDTVFVEGMPKSGIVEQNPIPNSKVKEGRIVYLSVNSSTSAMVIMPNLINSSLRFAETVIAGSGLKLGEIVYQPDIAQNAVLDQLFNGQSIQPNTKLPKGSFINLVVGDGSGGVLVAMPDLTGLGYKDVTAVLKSSMLQIGAVVFEDENQDTASAVVVRQNPVFQPGATIKSGQAIDVFLSTNK